MKKLALVLGLFGLLSLAGAGCHPQMANSVVTAAIITAAIIGTAQAMHYHDGHHHHANCGHHRRYYEGHWVYYYNGHWEYYDSYEEGRLLVASNRRATTAVISQTSAAMGGKLVSALAACWASPRRDQPFEPSSLSVEPAVAGTANVLRHRKRQAVPRPATGGICGEALSSRRPRQSPRLQ